MGPEQALTGWVVAAHGRHVVVESAPGQTVRCHLRGRQQEAVVGDEVVWLPSGDEGVIETIRPRRNLLQRQDAWKSKSFAANVDALLLLVAVDPGFSDSLILRALIAAASAGVPAWMLLNKTDLDGVAPARARLLRYRELTERIEEVSLKTDPQGSRSQLERHLRGRTTLVLGPSGAGKSTLINLMVPDAGAQVGELSAALRSGKHTTTATRWYALPDQDSGQVTARAGRSGLIDSPGFQTFGLHHIDSRDLPALMPDWQAHLGHCRFHNCTHRQEPGCAIRTAVDQEGLDRQRYEIYLTLLDELSTPRRS